MARLLRRFLLYGAALSVGILGAQTQFGFVALQVQQLLGVEGSAPLPDIGRRERVYFIEEKKKSALLCNDAAE